MLPRANPLARLRRPVRRLRDLRGASLLGNVAALLAPAARRREDEAAEGPPPRTRPRRTSGRAAAGCGPRRWFAAGQRRTGAGPVAVAVAAGGGDGKAGGGRNRRRRRARGGGAGRGSRAVASAARGRLAAPPRRRGRDADGPAQVLVPADRPPAGSRTAPVNGILLVLPYGATDNAADAAQAGELCRQDLAAARESLHVHCPVQALVGDLETAVGFPELVRHFDERQRQQLLGRPLPDAAAVSQGRRQHAGHDRRRGTGWLCQEMLPSLVYRHLHLEAPEGPTLPEAVADNGRLVQFLGEWRRRRPHLSRLLTQGLAAAPGEPALLSGCHLGATGPDPAGGQAFVHGVFRLLVEDQNYVFWTRAAPGRGPPLPPADLAGRRRRRPARRRRRRPHLSSLGRVKGRLRRRPPNRKNRRTPA